MQRCRKNEKLFPIPGFDGYVINRNGHVFSLKMGRMRRRKPQLGSSGYLELSLAKSNGEFRIGIHRLLAITFIPVSENLIGLKLVVNHKNGVKHDNRLSNLEWVTYQGNAEHAGRVGLTTKCVPVSMVMSETFEVTDFPSATACAAAIGMSKDIVLWRLKFGGSRLAPDGFYYIKTKDKQTFFDSLSGGPKRERRGGRGTKVSILFLLSGEILTFDSQRLAANYLQVSEAALSIWLTADSQPVLPKCILAKYADDPRPWRQVYDVYGDLRAFTKLRIVVVIDSYGVVTYYTSAAACCKATGLKPTGISYRLKTKGQVVFSDGNRYAYLEDAGLGPVRGVTPD